MNSPEANSEGSLKQAILIHVSKLAHRDASSVFKSSPLNCFFLLNCSTCEIALNEVERMGFGKDSIC